MQVLYIGGAGRSGSTLIEILLGNLPEYFSVGELRHFWEYWVEETRTCGCGALLRQCPFWSEVVTNLELSEQQIQQIARLARQFDRSHYIPLLRKQLEAPKPHLVEFLTATQNLYLTIGKMTGARILVDSSKTPAHFLMLKKALKEDITVLHLVRDGRAVAYAWNKRAKLDPSLKMPQEAHMPQRNLSLSIIRWMLENYYMSKLGQGQTNYEVLRYEDFVSDPVNRLRQGLKKLEGSEGDIRWLEQIQKHMHLNPTHSVGGNPIRFQNERLSIMPDQAWIYNMSASSRMWLTILAFPVLRKFGYPTLFL